MCAGKNLSFNLKLFSPLRTPKHLDDKASRVRDSDADSEASVLTRDIRKEVKAIKDKVNNKMSDDSDTSLFKTQLFPSQKSKNSGHDISSSDVSSSDESDLDLEELKRDLEKKAVAKRQSLLSKSAKHGDNNNNKKLKQTSNSPNNQSSSGFTALKRKSCDSSGSEEESDSKNNHVKKKVKLDSKGQSTSQTKEIVSKKQSKGGKKDGDSGKKLDSDTESDSDSSVEDLDDISSTLNRTKGFLKEQSQKAVEKVELSSDSSDLSSDSDDSDNDKKNSSSKSPKGKEGNSSITKGASSNSVKESQSAMKTDRSLENVRNEDYDSDASTMSSTVSSIVQVDSSEYKDNAEKVIQADLDFEDKSSYDPPKGFQYVDLKTKKFVKMEQLKGKQLFLIKAPSKFQFGQMDFGGQKIDMNGSSVICNKKSNTEYVVNVNRKPSKQIQNLRCMEVRSDGSGYKMCIGNHIDGVIHIKNKPAQIPQITYTKQPDIKHKVSDVTRPPMMPFASESPVREELSDEIITQPRKKKKNKKAVLDKLEDLNNSSDMFSGSNSDDKKVKKKKNKKEKLSDLDVETDRENLDQLSINEKSKSKKRRSDDKARNGKSDETKCEMLELSHETDAEASTLTEIPKKKKKKEKMLNYEVDREKEKSDLHFISKKNQSKEIGRVKNGNISKSDGIWDKKENENSELKRKASAILEIVKKKKKKKKTKSDME